MSQNHCTKCGRLIHNAQFCSNCGASVKSQSLPTSRNIFKLDGIHRVVLGEILADVEIEPVKGSTVKITAKGGNKAIRVDQRASVVTISAPLPFGKGSGLFGEGIFTGNFVGEAGLSTITINNQLFIDGMPVDRTQRIEVKITVPYGTSIKIGNLIGSCQIGNVNGNLVITSPHITNINVGQIKALNASIGGNTNAHIQNIKGNSIEIIADGNSDIYIQDGHANLVEVIAGGSSNVALDVVADTAKVSVDGSSGVFIKEIEGDSIKILAGGSTDVHIQNGYAKLVEVTADGSSNVVLDVVADNAEVSASGSSDVRLAKCKTAPTKRRSGSSSISVGCTSSV